MRDLRVGEEILVITWLDRAARDVQSTYLGSDPSGPVLGVFSLRSPEMWTSIVVVSGVLPSVLAPGDNGGSVPGVGGRRTWMPADGRPGAAV